MAVVSEWNITSDIYNIVETVDNLKKRYVEDENETTLALGIFGFIGDLESKKIQSAIIQTGELGNEMFPSRARLEKNILAHAIYQNVNDINARPSSIVATIGIKISDLDKYMMNDRFIFDRTNPIYIDDYEFHFDYDVILQKNQTAQMSNPVYSARYDMTVKNPISVITSPYLKQPFVINLYNTKYVVFQATLRQVTIEWTSDKLVTNSIIDNKTFLFEFTNQLADFVVYVTENGKTTRLTPVFYGSPVDSDIEYYCWYIYTNSNTVRITFDAASFIPGLNADVTVEAQTTLGAGGIFDYDENEALFTTFDSPDYGYSNVTCYLLPASDSYNGKDRKTVDELKKIIPKFALSRGYLTTETDINNYFNLINTDTNRLKLQKKVDNQLNRIWYSYFLLKDEYGNIVPTNTCNIRIDTTDGSCVRCEDGRMVVPAGTYFSYDPVSKIARVIDESVIPELYSEEFFNDNEYYYISVFNIAICKDPLYAAFYMTNTNTDSYYVFDWVNDNCDLQFVANRNNVIRKLLTDRNVYTFSFSIAQSVNQDYQMYYEDRSGGKVEIVNNMKCILLLYRDSEPYRWVECNLTEFNKADWSSSWEVNIETDNELDNKNYIKLLDLNILGSEEKNYGYFETSPKAYLYILARFNDEYGRYDLDQYVPGLEGYSVTNRYEVEGGINLFYNYTSMMNTKITSETDTVFKITGFPLVGAHYMMDEDYVRLFLDSMNSKKIYIEECLTVLENSMDVDFKFFNTYGPSVTYTIGDKRGTLINHVDIEMKFRTKLISSTDAYTKSALLSYIKNYIEDFNGSSDLHFPNLITELETKFGNTVEYVEYMNFNKFWLGVQHIELIDPDDPHIVPEFICIRNKYNKETEELEPCIEIECNG